MWTCSKCGESIEDQFDSCWKCAGEARKEMTPAAAPKLKWFQYVFAVHISYAIPWLAILLLVSSVSQHTDVRSPERSPEAGIFYDLPVWLWMTVPAAINFLIFLPFLKSRALRLFVLLCLG